MPEDTTEACRARNKEIGAGDLIQAIAQVHNDLLLEWQITPSTDPDAKIKYAIAAMLDTLIDRIEYEVQDNAEMVNACPRCKRQTVDGETMSGKS